MHLLKAIDETLLRTRDEAGPHAAAGAARPRNTRTRTRTWPWTGSYGPVRPVRSVHPGAAHSARRDRARGPAGRGWPRSQRLSNERTDLGPGSRGCAARSGRARDSSGRDLPRLCETPECLCLPSRGRASDAAAGLDRHRLYRGLAGRIRWPPRAVGARICPAGCSPGRRAEDGDSGAARRRRAPVLCPGKQGCGAAPHAPRPGLAAGPAVLGRTASCAV